MTIQTYSDRSQSNVIFLRLAFYLTLSQNTSEWYQENAMSSEFRKLYLNRKYLLDKLKSGRQAWLDEFYSMLLHVSADLLGHLLVEST